MQLPSLLSSTCTSCLLDSESRLLSCRSHIGLVEQCHYGIVHSVSLGQWVTPDLTQITIPIITSTTATAVAPNPTVTALTSEMMPSLVLDAVSMASRRLLRRGLSSE